MNIRSYYTKVIFTLAAVFLLLFLFLGVIDGLIIERSIKTTLSVAQQRRMYGIFKELYRLQQHKESPAQVQDFIDHRFY